MSSVHEMDCLWEETVSVPGRSGYDNVNVFGSSYCCCTNSILKEPVADLYRWSWGRWRVSEEL